MDTGIADEIIPVETSESKPLLYVLGAFLWIRVEGWMTKGLAAELSEVLPILGAEQSQLFWTGKC